MKIHDCEQRTEEWHKLRLGRVTGTKYKELVGKPATLEALCRKIAAEKLIGISCEKSFRITDAMQHGIDMEDEARAVYEMETLTPVKQVGFISKDALFGISPDGLTKRTEWEAGVEFKCPQSNTHLGYLMNPQSLVKQYNWQLQGSLWVTGLPIWDIVSYCPDFPEDKRLLIYTVTPKEEDQEKITKAAAKLKSRVKEILESLQ